MPEPAEPKKVQLIAVVALVALFGGITFHQLGRAPLANFDEGIYAQVAREAAQNHSQLGFTWVGNVARHRSELWFEKPPLMIWMIESAERLFGVNEFAARFWTAIFAVLTLPLTFLFAKKISGSTTAGLLAVASFFAATQFVDYARVLQLDIPVGFFILLALYSFWESRERPRFHLLFWIAIATGVMIKSVIGLLPLPIIAVFALLGRDFAFLKQKSFWGGFGLFLAMVLPWHIVEQVRYGKAFWDQYLFYHLLDRYSTTLEGNSGGFWFYGEIFFQESVLFWTLLSLGVFIMLARRSREFLFVTIAFLFIFLFFSIAGTKLPAYLLVIYPYMAIMVGTALAILLNVPPKTRWTSIGPVLITLAFVAQGLCHAPFKSSRDSAVQMASDKAVGEFLKTYEPDQPVYYQSVAGLKPAIMFYADRPIGYFQDYPKSKPTGKFLLIAETTPDYPDKTVVFSAETEKVYQVR